MKLDLKDKNGEDLNFGDEITISGYGTRPIPEVITSQIGFSQGVYSAFEINGNPIPLRDVIRLVEKI